MKYVVRAYDGLSFLPPETMLDAVESAGVKDVEILVIESRAKVFDDEPPAVDRAYLFIMDAASNAELEATLRKLPMWSMMTWHATRLDTYEEFIAAGAMN